MDSAHMKTFIYDMRSKSLALCNYFSFLIKPNMPDSLNCFTGCFCMYLNTIYLYTQN